MPKQPQHHAAQTVGGKSGHYLRRIIHVSMAAVPFLYYEFFASIADCFGLSQAHLLWIIMLFTVLLEGVRLRFKWVVPGQRQHELLTISSFAWGTIGLCTVFWLLPEKAYAVPIIITLAWGDPLLGYFRRSQWPLFLKLLFANLVVIVIWWVCSVWLPTPWWLALVIAPITVAAEWPCFRWVDDNGLMLITPTLFILGLRAIGVAL